MTLKIFLLVYLILFYGVAFFWRTYRVWRTTGINPYRLYEKEGLPGFMATYFRLIVVGTILVVLIKIFADRFYQALTPITWLERPLVTGIGLVLLVVAFGWVAVAQAQMGASWRIGIDTENKTALVTKGLFRLSRNPIFLGMRLNLLGLFLVLPNAVTLALWLLGDVSIQTQVYLEEEHLLTVHREAYEQYRKRVRRWL
jgi:protein-S-isoprenylcysteine O-methyltransferase Ste14